MGSLSKSQSVGPLSQILSRRTALGGWCSIGNSFSAEIVASAGVDFIVIDLQHGMVTFSDLTAMLQAVMLQSVIPLVRVPIGGHAIAQKALDAGAHGIIFPWISTPEEANDLVSNVRYPPTGIRSFGPTRARLHMDADPGELNGLLIVLAQIENRMAMENLEAIINTPGLDGVYVGPNDLAISHELPIGAQSNQMDDMLGRIVRTANNAHRMSGCHTFGAEAAKRAVDRGFKLVSVSNDVATLRSGYKQTVASLLDTTTETTTPYY